MHDARRVDADDAERHALRAFVLDENAVSALDRDAPAPPVRANASTVSTVSDKAPTVAATKARSRRRRHGAQTRTVNVSRERMLHEIATLRQQEIALQERLAVLQRGGPDPADQTREVMQLAWQTIARDQQAQREAVEKERDMLRAQIKRNNYSIQRVQRFLQKVRVPEMLSGPTSCYVFPALELEASFAVVSQQLDLMVTQIDAIFQHAEMDQLMNEFQDLRVVNDMASQFSVECRDSRLVPFDDETSAEAMWLHRQTRASAFALGNHQVLEKTRNSIRRRFAVTVRGFQSGKSTSYFCSVARRFVRGKDRLILYCCLCTRTNENADGGSTSSRYLLSSWTRIRSTHNPALAAINQPASRVEVIERGKPIAVSSSVDPREAREFCTHIMTQVQRVERQAVENLLLDVAQRSPLPRMSPNATSKY